VPFCLSKPRVNIRYESDAFFAAPENSQVFQVGLEPIFLYQHNRQRRQHGFVKIYNLATPGANEVVMMLVANAMETHAAVAHVRLGYHPGFFQ
jgi:hypothetical protein